VPKGSPTPTLTPTPTRPPRPFDQPLHDARAQAITGMDAVGLRIIEGCRFLTCFETEFYQLLVKSQSEAHIDPILVRFSVIGLPPGCEVMLDGLPTSSIVVDRRRLVGVNQTVTFHVQASYACLRTPSPAGAAFHLRLEVDHNGDDGSALLDDDDDVPGNNILDEVRIIR